MAARAVFILIVCGMAASQVVVPKLKLNDGREMPAIALGTYLGFNQNGTIRSQNHQLRDVIRAAIRAGYRHIDTATVYETEGEIGEGINDAVREGEVTREEMFVTTKLWNTHHRREQVLAAVKNTLEKMGLDYIDLYIMHWPIGLNEDYSESAVDYMETWRGMEDAHRQGLVRSLGASNFNKEQISRLVAESAVKPVALQIEIHPQIIQTELVAHAQGLGLVVMGYSPLGSLVQRYGLTMPGPKADDPGLAGIARRTGKTAPQVVLRWLVERKIVPVVKTTNPKRLEENINIFDFNLEKDDMDVINSFNSNTRYTLPSFWQNHPYYPFDKIDNPVANPFVKA